MELSCCNYTFSKGGRSNYNPSDPRFSLIVSLDPAAKKDAQFSLTRCQHVLSDLQQTYGSDGCERS
jgi:hypothetical protein